MRHYKYLIIEGGLAGPMVATIFTLRVISFLNNIIRLPFSLLEPPAHVASSRSTQCKRIYIIMVWRGTKQVAK